MYTEYVHIYTHIYITYIYMCDFIYMMFKNRQQLPVIIEGRYWLSLWGRVLAEKRHEGNSQGAGNSP